ncbi:MAG: glycosyltransferase family 4 protein [Erysipelotrichaceae bacterium]
MKNTLIYWRNVPMDVDLGSFEYIANNWKGKIIIICFDDILPERKLCDWNNPEFKNVSNIIVPSVNNPRQFIKKIINDNSDAIHIFNGLIGKQYYYLKYYLKKSLNPRICIMGERPNFYGGKVELSIRKILVHIIYRYFSFKLNDKVSCFLPMGLAGVNTYIKYGWDKNKMFQYMYNPKLPEVINKSSLNLPVKLLYIGRFDATAKGVDILMSAIDKLERNESWQLDMVGGYGEIKDEVIDWCDHTDNVRYLGTWKSDEVCNKMCEYDLCIVPSRYDGWNLTPNQAINSGIATIITDESGSNELIEYSDSGFVIEANSVNALHEALLTVINNPSLLKKWKTNSLNYKEKISSKQVGKYFIDILEYSFGEENKSKPICPWAVY